MGLAKAGSASYESAVHNSNICASYLSSVEARLRQAPARYV